MCRRISLKIERKGTSSSRIYFTIAWQDLSPVSPAIFISAVPISDQPVVPSGERSTWNSDSSGELSCQERVIEWDVVLEMAELVGAAGGWRQTLVVAEAVLLGLDSNSPL